MYYWVYDIRTTMTEASGVFPNREDAEAWGMFKHGEHAHISPIKMHRTRTYERPRRSRWRKR